LPTTQYLRRRPFGSTGIAPVQIAAWLPPLHDANNFDAERLLEPLNGQSIASVVAAFASRVPLRRRHNAEIADDVEPSVHKRSKERFKAGD
jgi:hypothetical protein